MNNIRYIILVLFLLMLGACAPAAPSTQSLTSGVSFRPIEEIIEQPLQVTNFENDGSARLPIQTKIPVACTIVYGKTNQFGSLSLDQDMAGGAHTDHSPLLLGLDPETTYYFRVQGVDASGVVYLSEVMTFTTPPRETVAVENLASPLLGAEIIGYSSAFGDAAPTSNWGIANAFDDNPNTAWSSGGDGDAAWVEIKLAQPARVTAVSFHSRSMADGSAITQAFTVTTETGQVFGPFSLPDASQPHQFEVAFVAQTLKFELMDTTGGNTGAVDIAIYGEFTK
jgi:hypothetical protein